MAEHEHSYAYPTVSPYLSVSRAAEAIGWYGRAFGATEAERYEHEGKIGHATLTLPNGGVVMLSDEFPEHAAVVGTATPERLGGTTVTVNLMVDDADAWFGRATAAGAATLRAPQDEFYGRHAKLRDPFGHVWSLIGPKKG